MCKRLLLPAPLLGILLLLTAPHLPVAHSSAPGNGGGREGRRPHTPYPEGQEDHAHCQVCRLAEQVGVRITPLVPRTRYRCMPAERPLWAATPRGRVRLADLAQLQVQFSIDVETEIPDFLEDPFVELRCGATPLGRVRLPFEDVTESVALPYALRTKLRGLRGRITWGRFDGGGPESQASIWIDPTTRAEKRALRGMRRRLTREPAWIRDVLEAQILLDQAFDHGAMLRARAVLAQHPGEPHAAAVLQAAYARMGVTGTNEGLDHDELVYELRRTHDRAGAAACHLDEPARPPGRRAPGPRAPRPGGGCGSGH